MQQIKPVKREAGEVDAAAPQGAYPYVWSSILILLGLIFIQSAYMLSFYLLLTTDNTFNFNNNYHVIAFITCLAVLFGLTLFFLWVSHWQCLRQTSVRNLVSGHAAGMVYFSLCLFSLAAIVLPFVLYFMLMDDFVLRGRLLIPVILGAGLFVYAYWGQWQDMLRKEGMVWRIIYLVLFSVLILLLLEILTGIIPTPIRTGNENVIFPL